MGVASSSRTFFQQIGGSIGVSLFGAIFARRLTTTMTAQAARRAPERRRRAASTRRRSTTCRP